MPTLRTFAEPIDDTVMVKIPKEYASYSFQVILVPYKAMLKRKQPADIHIFDSLHSDWGGDRGIDEIAGDIRASRHIERQPVEW